MASIGGDVPREIRECPDQDMQDEMARVFEDLQDVDSGFSVFSTGSATTQTKNQLSESILAQECVNGSNETEVVPQINGGSNTGYGETGTDVRVEESADFSADISPAQPTPETQEIDPGESGVTVMHEDGQNTVPERNDKNEETADIASNEDNNTNTQLEFGQEENGEVREEVKAETSEEISEFDANKNVEEAASGAEQETLQENEGTEENANFPEKFSAAEKQSGTGDSDFGQEESMQPDMPLLVKEVTVPHNDISEPGSSGLHLQSAETIPAKDMMMLVDADNSVGYAEQAERIWPDENAPLDTANAKLATTQVLCQPVDMDAVESLGQNPFEKANDTDVMDERVFEQYLVVSNRDDEPVELRPCIVSLRKLTDAEIDLISCLPGGKSHAKKPWWHGQMKKRKLNLSSEIEADRFEGDVLSSVGKRRRRPPVWSKSGEFEVETVVMGDYDGDEDSSEYDVDDSDHAGIVEKKIEPEEWCCVHQACSKLFASERSMKQHYGMVHARPALPPQVVQCSQCGSRLERKALATHMQKFHSQSAESEDSDTDQNRRPVTCPICKKRVIHAGYVVHMSGQHIDHAKSYNCDVCGDNVPTITYHLHMSKHSDEEMPVRCGQCQEMVQEQHIKEHTINHLKDKYKPIAAKVGDEDGSLELSACPECHKYLSTDDLAEHRYMEHGVEAECKCAICSISLPGTFQLKMHYRQEHPGETPPGSVDVFKCRMDDCERVYTNKSLLNFHERLHTLAKPYKCGICAVAYESLEEVTAHSDVAHPECAPRTKVGSHVLEAMQEHTKGHEMEDTVYKVSSSPSIRCNVCDKMFVSDMTRFQHMMKVHTNVDTNDLRCDPCQQIFATKVDYRRHNMTASHIQLASSEKIGVCFEPEEGKALWNEEDWPSEFALRADGLLERSDPPCIYKCQVCSELKQTYELVVCHLDKIHHVGDEGRRIQLQATDSSVGGYPQITKSFVKLMVNDPMKFRKGPARPRVVKKPSTNHVYKSGKNIWLKTASSGLGRPRATLPHQQKFVISMDQMDPAVVKALKDAQAASAIIEKQQRRDAARNAVSKQLESLSPHFQTVQLTSGGKSVTYLIPQGDLATCSPNTPVADASTTPSINSPIATPALMQTSQTAKPLTHHMLEGIDESMNVKFHSDIRNDSGFNEIVIQHSKDVALDPTGESTNVTVRRDGNVARLYVHPECRMNIETDTALKIANVLGQNNVAHVVVNCPQPSEQPALQATASTLIPPEATSVERESGGEVKPTVGTGPGTGATALAQLYPEDTLVVSVSNNLIVLQYADGTRSSSIQLQQVSGEPIDLSHIVLGKSQAMYWKDFIQIVSQS